MTMGANWQLIATLAIVAVAAGYLGWRGWRVLRRKSGCGSACGGCGTAKSGGKDVVELSDAFDRATPHRR
jgi:hypothetical protein